MKAITIHQYGGSASLNYEEVPKPELNEGQVVVEILARSVNHIDIKMASGDYKGHMPLEFPWIPGADYAGRIDYISPGVEGFKVGDEVYGKCSGGSYAEYLTADPGTFALMPANLSFAEAASVPHVGLTAWEAVFEHGRIEPGQTVLIHGASGAVGSFTTQFAKLAGAYVYAVDKGTNTAFLTSIGADTVIDYTTTDFAQVVKDIDLVLDFVGKDTPKKSYPVLKKGGRLVSTAAQIDENEGKEYGITALYMGVKPNYDDLAEMTRLIEAGKVKVDVAEIFPLSEAEKAWNEFLEHGPEKKHAHGKIVLSNLDAPQ